MFPENIPLTLDGLIGVLYALVAVMLIVVLYHILFIVVDLRKIARRFEDTTAQVEAMILKPLAIIDEAFQWVIDHVHTQEKKHHKKGKHEHEIDVEVTKV
jgi:hypothetical protein